MSRTLMEFQTDTGIAGNVCEIGVHHGRYLIALATMLAPHERAIAIDLFENQHENIDKSGQGNRKAFLAAVHRFLNPRSVETVQGNSLRMTPEDIARYGGVRFFSIDGGHTEKTTENDLWLAERSITPEGIVVVDDILSWEWSGVIGGVANYKHNGGDLVGFALIPKKLVLCRIDQVDRYRKLLRQRYNSNRIRENGEFLGYEVDVYRSLPDHLVETMVPSDRETLLSEIDSLQKELERLRRGVR
jgi:hypothetical protein